MNSKPQPIEPLAPEDRSPGELLRQARRAHRLSQKQLAIRAGTTQSAIARTEADRVSPSIKTLTTLFQAMEEDFVFGTRPRDWGVDLSLNRRNLKCTPTQRLERGLGISEAVGETREEIGQADARRPELARARPSTSS